MSFGFMVYVMFAKEILVPFMVLQEHDKGTNKG